MVNRIEIIGLLDLIPVVANFVDPIKVFEPACCRFALADLLELFLDVAEGLLCHHCVVTFVGGNGRVDREMLREHAPSGVSGTTAVLANRINSFIAALRVETLHATGEVMHNFKHFEFVFRDLIPHLVLKREKRRANTKHHKTIRDDRRQLMHVRLVVHDLSFLLASLDGLELASAHSVTKANEQSAAQEEPCQGND